MHAATSSPRLRGSETLARIGRPSRAARSDACSARVSSSARRPASAKGSAINRRALRPARAYGLRLAPPARYRDLARPHHLDQAERADHLLDRLDLVVRARDLDR